jgi:hypothetical protein
MTRVVHYLCFAAPPPGPQIPRAAPTRITHVIDDGDYATPESGGPDSRAARYA